LLPLPPSGFSNAIFQRSLRNTTAAAAAAATEVVQQ